MAKQPKIIPGSRFGDLTAANRGRQIGPRKFWECRCVCGVVKLVLSAHLLSGHTKSCGCRTARAKSTHGMSRSPEYGVWQCMIQRCSSRNNTHYADYGGRGIGVCARWLNSFENFYADMWPRPSLKHTLERKDNDGNYGPSNCTWATRKEQANNRRITNRITIGDVTKTTSEWSKELGIKSSTLNYRAASKFSPNDIVFAGRFTKGRKRL